MNTIPKCPKEKCARYDTEKHRCDYVYRGASSDGYAAPRYPRCIRDETIMKMEDLYAELQPHRFCIGQEVWMYCADLYPDATDFDTFIHRVRITATSHSRSGEPRYTTDLKTAEEHWMPLTVRESDIASSRDGLMRAKKDERERFERKRLECEVEAQVQAASDEMRKKLLKGDK